MPHRFPACVCQPYRLSIQLHRQPVYTHARRLEHVYTCTRSVGNAPAQVGESQPTDWALLLCLARLQSAVTLETLEAYPEEPEVHRYLQQRLSAFDYDTLFVGAGPDTCYKHCPRVMLGRAGNHLASVKRTCCML